jgi:outer membrane usher protein
MHYILWKRPLHFLPCALTGAIMTILLVSAPLQAQSNDVVLMKVILNGEDKGEHFFILLNEKAPYFKAEDLSEIGLIGIFRNGRYGLYRSGIFKNERYRIKSDTYISLNSLYPRVRYEIDMKASVIYIIADPKLLEDNVFDLSYKTPHNVLRPQHRSSFLNYRIRYSLDDNFEYKSLGIPWELGSNINGSLLFSNFSYARAETDEKHVRLNTNITTDDPSLHSRLVLGDFSASSGELGSGGSYGGVSFSSSFAAEPFFITYEGVDLTFQIESPSDVEIYVNNLLVDRRNLPPGEFTFSNLPHATGSGRITVVIKDAYGRTKRLEKGFFTSPILLKPGISEYSYNIGLKREEFGEESFKYGDPAFLAHHRFGLSKYLTAGFRLETNKDVVNAGSMIDLALGKIGALRLSAAGSYGEKEYGYAGSYNYTFSTRGFSFGLSGRGLTREYSTLSLNPFEDKPRSVTNTGAGFNLGRFGSLSLSYSFFDRYTETDTTRKSLTYSKRFTSGLSLYTSASRTEEVDVIEEASVNLNFLLGRGSSGSLSRRIQEDRTSDTFSFQKNSPAGPGFGFNFLAEHEKDDLNGSDETYGYASIQYNGPYGIYSTDYYRSGELDTYDLTASGAISFIDGSLHLSRPIMDSFALVKVGRLENVNVRSNNQYVGKTSSRGRLLVPNLGSYSNNLLSIDDSDIPVNYEIDEMEKYVSTQLRAGGVIEFNILKLQGFGGYLFFVDQGEKVTAEYAALEVKAEENLYKTVIGRGGEFYLENIPSGKWPARLYLEDRWCGFNMVFPESEEMFVDMGEIACETN